MVTSTCHGDYIPYRYFQVPERNEIRIFTRGVEKDDRKTFVHTSSRWIIIDPHHYIDETDDDIMKMLSSQFQTTSVAYDERSRRFVVKDSTMPLGADSFSVDEQFFKSVNVLPDNYTTHIVMNQKRFYNCFESDGSWLTSRQAKNHQSHHYFLTKEEFCKATNPTQTQGPKSFRKALHDVDIIFSNLDQDSIERLYGGIPNEIDFVRVPQIDEDSSKALIEIGVWYSENIAQLYKLSFISSRNLSDVWPQNKEISRKIAEDILLGLNLSLYSNNGVVIADRIPESFGERGKYSNVHFYQISTVLRKLLEESTDPITHEVGVSLEGIENFSDIITTIFLSQRLLPAEFMIPEDSVFYFDRRVLCSTERLPIEDYGVPTENVDYAIVLGAQSMIKCIKSNNFGHRLNESTRSSTLDQEDHIIPIGIHHICQPLFPAAWKAVKRYAIAMMYDYKTEWEMITRFVDQTGPDFEIDVIVTSSNIDQYKYLLDSEELELMEKKNVELKISVWLTGVEANQLSRKFEHVRTIAPSLSYIKRVLRVLDLIPVRK